MANLQYQAKKMRKSEKHLKGCHVTVKGCQVKNFCEIVQLWKNFEYPRCFIYINRWNNVVFFFIRY